MIPRAEGILSQQIITLVPDLIIIVEDGEQQQLTCSEVDAAAL